MKLLIISNMAHYQREGQIVGWGPTVQEIDHLAGLFEEVRHVACLHAEPAAPSALPYSSSRVKLIPVAPAGGNSLVSKIGILRLIPLYLCTMLRELPCADVVHVRCPANVALLAIVLLGLVRSPKLRWVKYAGNWRPAEPESWSYTFQRWWLRNGLHRGFVTVNGRWPDDPPHVRPFINPCLTDAELTTAREGAMRKELDAPIRLLFVGRVETEKGAGRALEILGQLRRMGCQSTLDLVGDGPERCAFETRARKLALDGLVRFHGWLSRKDLCPYFTGSHFMLLPTVASEGWPKVLSEAMAYGAVPLAGNVSCIPQFLSDFGCGQALDPLDIHAFAAAVQAYAANKARWSHESRRASEAASAFTYSRYLADVRNLLSISP